jgi:hypothetical protein
VICQRDVAELSPVTVEVHYLFSEVHLFCRSKKGCNEWANKNQHSLWDWKQRVERKGTIRFHRAITYYSFMCIFTRNILNLLYLLCIYIDLVKMQAHKKRIFLQKVFNPNLYREALHAVYYQFCTKIYLVF